MRKGQAKQLAVLEPMPAEDTGSWLKLDLLSVWKPVFLVSNANLSGKSAAYPIAFSASSRAASVWVLWLSTSYRNRILSAELMI